MIRVLVVDDSAFMRKALSLMIDRDPELEVIGTARDGEDGYHKTRDLKPDVVTVDIEMPRTDGLKCIELIMHHDPTPILVVSSLTTKGAKITLKALDLGAVDYIPKSQSYIALDITKIEAKLCEKIKIVANTPKRQKRPMTGKDSTTEPFILEASNKSKDYFDLSSHSVECIAIGVSTGGPPVLQKILTALPANFSIPILIAQHMPREFTKTFAERLDSLSELCVKEAENGEILAPGTVYIGKGGEHVLLRRRGHQIQVRVCAEPTNLLYHPSADVLFESLSEVYGAKAVGLILTGMGEDGLLGLKKMGTKGSVILAQSKASCVVYGMPRAAVEEGIVTKVLDINGLITSIQSAIKS